MTAESALEAVDKLLSDVSAAAAIAAIDRTSAMFAANHVSSDDEMQDTPATIPQESALTDVTAKGDTIDPSMYDWKTFEDFKRVQHMSSTCVSCGVRALQTAHSSG